MGGKSGSGTIKTNLRKVKSGYDQEFTLQKGVSAAPIKQVKVKNTYTNPKPVKNTEVPVIIPKGTKMVTIKPYTQKQGWTPVGGKSGEGLGVYKVTRGTHKGKTVVIPTYKVPASNVKKILKDLYKWK